DEPVCHPGSDDRREVDQPAVGAHDRGGGRIVQAEAALGDSEVEVVQQKRLHAVEAEPLPHLHAAEVGKRHGVPEEGAFLRCGRVCCCLARIAHMLDSATPFLIVRNRKYMVYVTVMMRVEIVTRAVRSGSRTTVSVPSPAGRARGSAGRWSAARRCPPRIRGRGRTGAWRPDRRCHWLR